MLGKDLIKWIKDNKAEELPVSVQYRDDEGYYSSEEYLDHPDLVDNCEGYCRGFYMTTYEFKRRFPDKNPADFDKNWKNENKHVHYGGRRIVL